MKRKAPTAAQILAALPAAMWLFDQDMGDTRARGFIPEATTAADLVRVAREVVAAALAKPRAKGRK